MTGFVQSKIELERDVQNELLNWKNKRHHTVLQIEGPWHVGKTHEVKKFVYSHYKQVVYVNLVRDEYGFEDLMLTDHFMREYCRNAGIGEYVDDESTVLVIDEIQERANVYNAIRDLREQLGCDIIPSRMARRTAAAVILPEPSIPETSSFRQGLRTFKCTRCHSKNFAEH